MRTGTLAVAGLVAVASAKTYTVIETVESTVTSCGPEVTNCPGSSQWNDWGAASSTPADVKSTTWAAWSSSTPDAGVKSTTWAAWSSGTPVKPTSTGSWSAWTSQTPAVTTSASWSAWTASSAVCPSYTETAPPAWFSQLPSNILSSVEAKWTAGPPSDWCYYTYSTTGTPVAPATTPAASASTWAAWTPSAATLAVSQYTGAANANGASLAIAGLAAAAAIVLA